MHGKHPPGLWQSQRKCSVNYSNCQYLLVLSPYETTHSSVIKGQDFYFFCIRVFPRPEDKGYSLLVSRSGKASKWLLTPDNTIPWMPLESLPVDPTPPRWTANIVAGLLRFRKFQRSSSPQAQQHHEAKEVPSDRFPSALFFNRDVWLLCNRCLVDDGAIRERPGFH